MCEPCCDFDFALEPLSGHLGGKLGGQDFHDDFSSEPSFLGEEDARHATAAELALDPVAVGQGGA